MGPFLSNFKTRISDALGNPAVSWEARTNDMTIRNCRETRTSKTQRETTIGQNEATRAAKHNVLAPNWRIESLFKKTLFFSERFWKWALWSVNFQTRILVAFEIPRQQKMNCNTATLENDQAGIFSFLTELNRFTSLIAFSSKGATLPRQGDSILLSPLWRCVTYHFRLY